MTLPMILIIVSLALPTLALALTLLNILTWPRGRAGAVHEGTVSILIPARNEEGTIEACVRAACTVAHPVLEVVVYDDASTDRTPEILAALQQEFSHLRVEKGAGELPPGWVGKPHACHQLGRLARGELLCFVDADNFLTPSGLGRIASLFEDLDASLVTAMPRQQTISMAERLILPLLHLTYTSWFPLVLTYLSRDVRFLAANGQILAIRREVYDRVGGFEAVRDEVVDDMAMCRLVKASGERVVFADGFLMSTCRMYGDARQVWEGFSKNIYEGLGANVLGLLFVLALYTMAFVAPYIALGVGLATGAAWTLYAALGVGANLALRVALAARYRHAPEGVLLHPLAVLGLLAIAINSFLWHARGAIQWSGRTYAARKAR